MSPHTRKENISNRNDEIAAGLGPIHGGLMREADAEKWRHSRDKGAQMVKRKSKSVARKSVARKVNSRSSAKKAKRSYDIQAGQPTGRCTGYKY